MEAYYKRFLKLNVDFQRFVTYFLSICNLTSSVGNNIIEDIFTLTCALLNVLKDKLIN